MSRKKIANITQATLTVPPPVTNICPDPWMKMPIKTPVHGISRSTYRPTRGAAHTPRIPINPNNPMIKLQSDEYADVTPGVCIRLIAKEKSEGSPK